MTDADRRLFEQELDRVALATVSPNASANVSGLGNSSLGCGLNCTAAPQLHYRFWVLFLLLFPCFTIFGNVLVVLAVCREKSLQCVTNYFIVSLAFADILVGAIVMPISVFVEVCDGVWILASLLCDLWIMCDALFSTASILNLVAISIDRFIAVTQPIKYSKHKNSKRSHLTIGATWLLSMCIALPIGCGLQNLNGVRQRPQFRNACLFFHGDFLIYSSLGSFYIPCVVMLCLYYRIFRVIWQRAKKASWTKKGRTYENPKATGAAGGGEAAKKALVVRARPSRPHQLSVAVAHGNQPELSCRSCSDDELVDNSANRLNESFTMAGPSTSDNSGGETCETRLDENGKRRRRMKLFPVRMKRPNGERSAARREKKATKTLAIVLGVFLLCWLPFFICNLMWAVCLKNIDQPLFGSPMCSFDRRISVFIAWLGYVNSTLNPLIYTIFNNEFRKAFKKLLRIE